MKSTICEKCRERSLDVESNLLRLRRNAKVMKICTTTETGVDSVDQRNIFSENAWPVI